MKRKVVYESKQLYMTTSGKHQ